MAENQSEWENGKDMNLNWLMEKASNKYNILKTKEIWEAPSAKEEKLIALEEQFYEQKKRVTSKKH